MKNQHLSSLFLMLLSGVSFAETTPAVTPNTASVPQTPAAITCETHIPKTTKIIEPAVLEQWATAATLQSFHLDAANLEPQLLALKPCYTDQGWQGFNDAFKKSGNRDAIKSKQLTVTSVLKGKPTLQTSKDNQWKISLPLEVTYKNAQQQLIQLLTIDVLVGRKASGDLGIMQLIAIPTKSPNTVETTGTTAPHS